MRGRSGVTMSLDGGCGGVVGVVRGGYNRRRGGRVIVSIGGIED